MNDDKDIFATLSEDSDNVEAVAHSHRAMPFGNGMPSMGEDVFATFTQEEPSEDDEALGLQPGDRLGDNIELIEVIGRGAMGEVWLAHEQTREFSRNVVVKVVPKNIRNFNMEVERVRETFGTIQSLQHKHICPVYRLVGNNRFGYGLVMKHLVGRNLSDFVMEYRKRNKKQPSIGELLPLLEQIASALDYAHDKGVIHRDIKPQNIFCGDEDGAQLIDFGLAETAQTDEKDSGTATVSGTVVYMSPEQLQGERQDKYSDQYSFAATVYELLAGQPPFMGHSDILRGRILDDPVNPIGKVAASVNEALARALAKSRNERFENCTKFVEALSTGERARQEQERKYRQLGEETKKASTEEDWRKLAVQFGAMNGYRNTAELAKECDKRYHKLNEHREERERREQYQRLCEETKKASTEEDWQNLIERFRAMNGYGNAVELANECDNQYRQMHEKRKKQEARDLNNSNILRSLKLKLYDRALETCEAAMADDLDNAEPFFYAAICLLKGERAFLSQRSEIDRIVGYLNTALELEPQKGIYHYLSAYIKYDYFERKSLNTTPAYREALAKAHAAGLAPSDVEQLFGILGVSRPEVL